MTAVSLLTKNALAKKLIPWQQQYGRNTLPWQKNPTPYRVWISEIMLQQTQVETVKAYYLRFMHVFPTLNDLAAADIDSVLQLWSGLGYYARARHLHRAAQMITSQFNGQFPNDLNTLTELPGIGQSTAGAILSLAMQQSAAILDGNVKRVLSRVYAIATWPGEAQTQKQLWAIAQHHTPKQQAGIYNQALMDLGSLVCTRNAPQCPLCPLRNHCLAYQHNQHNIIPIAKPKKTLPEKYDFIAILYHQKNHAILLEKRPSPGIWGGLWCFPTCPKPGRELNAWLPQNAQYLTKEPPISHTFSHYRWHLTPVRIQANNSYPPKTASEYFWYSLNNPPPLALAAAVKKLLSSI